MKMKIQYKYKIPNKQWWHQGMASRLEMIRAIVYFESIDRVQWALVNMCKNNPQNDTCMLHLFLISHFISHEIFNKVSDHLNLMALYFRPSRDRRKSVVIKKFFFSFPYSTLSIWFSRTSKFVCHVNLSGHHNMSCSMTSHFLVVTSWLHDILVELTMKSLGHTKSSN